jgi:adenylate kinase
MFEADANECVRRASGRRVDPQTGNIYHIEENPPPTDVKGLADRLQPINDADTNETKIKESYEVLK